jgi:hypothetical protein
LSGGLGGLGAEWYLASSVTAAKTPENEFLPKTRCLYPSFWVIRKESKIREQFRIIRYRPHHCHQMRGFVGLSTDNEMKSNAGDTGTRISQ